MPIRKTPLISGYIYHVLNRGIDRRPTFTCKKEFDRAISSLQYYKYSFHTVSLSKYNNKTNDVKKDLLKQIHKSIPYAEVLAYCLMPNHFHLLLKQIVDNGISKYMANFQNSYTKYFNTKHGKRIGPLFLNRYKAVLVESDSQLSHVSRYIHLNPYSSGLISKQEDLINYSWSSLKEYINPNIENISSQETLLKLFDNKSSRYINFVLNQADYQKKLNFIKHLLFDDFQKPNVPS